MQPDYSRRSRTKLITAVVAVLVVAGVILVVDHLRAANTAASSAATTGLSTQPTTSSTGANSTANGATNSTSTSSSASYKDGTYTASSEYYVPHGYESIDVSLTLKSGVVTDVSIQNSEGDHDSAQYQEDFASAYKTYVVGKSINSLQLNVISGASDTTQGFNDAVDKIASQAQA